MSGEKETLSALMDGEVNELELRRLLKSNQLAGDLAGRWHRYHLVSAAMKRQSIVTDDISDYVMSALQDDNMQTDSPHAVHSSSEGSVSPFSGMMKSFMSMGVAASVTAVVILGPSWIAQEQPAHEVTTQSSITSQPTAVMSDTTRPNGLLQPVTFGQQSSFLSSPQSLGLNDDMIRSPQGSQRYIDQHISLIESKPLEWGLAWLPEGYHNIRHESTRAGEVMVFSNGQKAFSVSVERLGMQTMPEGVIDAGDFIALGQVADDHFVTVVGDMPMMVAERIAAAVQTTQQ